MKKYYTVATLVKGKWHPQFGDYDRNVAREEEKEYKAEGFKTKLICTGDTQTEIDNYIKELNK